MTMSLLLAVLSLFLVFFATVGAAPLPTSIESIEIDTRERTIVGNIFLDLGCNRPELLAYHLFFNDSRTARRSLSCVVPSVTSAALNTLPAACCAERDTNVLSVVTLPLSVIPLRRCCDYMAFRRSNAIMVLVEVQKR